jgi:hypothetical protein
MTSGTESVQFDSDDLQVWSLPSAAAVSGMGVDALDVEAADRSRTFSDHDYRSDLHEVRPLVRDS